MKNLPSRPSLEPLRDEAKSLLKSLKAGEPDALDRLHSTFPHLAGNPEIALHDAQSVVAREYGFDSWTALKREVERRIDSGLDLATWRTAFLAAAFGSGFRPANLERAQAMQQAAPERVTADPYLSIATGQGTEIPAGPDPVTGYDPLTFACQSVFLRGEPRLRIHTLVRRMLDTGADPNVTYEDPQFKGYPLSALYGAVGKNADLELGRMLLEAGANPNDNESLYHSTEHGRPELMQLLLDFGAKIDGSNAVRRQLDYEDPAGLELLLRSGADPEGRAENSAPPLFWAIMRRRSPACVNLLIQYGADPHLGFHGRSYYHHALERGLPELAALFPPSSLTVVDEFVARAAAGKESEAMALGVHPEQLSPGHRQLLPVMAAAGNLAAVRAMLNLGWPVDTPGSEWGASALNQAVWHGNEPMTALLLEHGAQWTQSHGYGDNVRGTLHFGSTVRPIAEGDYAGCARLLVAAGMTAGDKDWPDEIAAIFA